MEEVCRRGQTNGSGASQIIPIPNGAVSLTLKAEFNVNPYSRNNRTIRCRNLRI